MKCGDRIGPFEIVKFLDEPNTGLALVDEHRTDTDVWRHQVPVSLLQLAADNEELQASMDIRLKADARAIKQWQGEDPSNRSLKWPDHADLVCWLGAQNERQREALEKIIAVDHEILEDFGENAGAEYGFRFGKSLAIARTALLIENKDER